MTADPASLQSQPPLIVDLDGTLLRTDTLFEGIVGAFFRSPTALLRILPSLFSGRARFKSEVAQLYHLDPQLLPVRDDLLSYLHDQHRLGREIHLMTAADQSIAEAIGRRFGLFHSVQGSADGANLKGKSKLAVLRARFPEGFAYAGDSGADLDVWRGAASIVAVGVPPHLERRIQKLAPPKEASFPSETGTLQSWRKAARLHQWTKNLILFVPLLLGHAYADIAAVWRCIAGFVLMGLAASGTYMINDLSDLAADRRHRSKRLRPFASGDLDIKRGAVVALALIGAGLSGAFALGPAAGLWLLTYLATTLSYTFRFKRVPLLDVFTIGLLYTIRILIGVSLANTSMSGWLVTFSMFFFFSLALAKRYVELKEASGRASENVLPGRGYVVSDIALVLSFGAASAFASILILVLYLIEEAFPDRAYGTPEYLWAAPILVGLWTMRIWLLADRGELDDDPVTFATGDPISIGLGATICIFFLAAVLL